jgi:DNA-binding GntR family transcriptional regulator
MATDLVKLNKQDLEGHGPYEILGANTVDLRIATQTIGARVAPAAEACLLDETRGACLLTMERTVYNARGRPVDHGQHIYRSTR